MWAVTTRYNMATFGELIHGRKPEVAPFIPTDPIAMLKKLLSGEIKDWPQIEQLGNLYQTYMTQGIEKLFPNFSDVLSQGGIDTQNLLQSAEPLTRGELPEDVKQQVLRSSAYQGLMAGTLGGPMGAALGARDLGLTSLDLMKQGAGLLGEAGNAAQRWAGLASGTMMNPSSQMYSPQWFSQFMAEQNAAKQATKQLRYNVAAAPDPAWADRAKLFASILGMAGGGMMGGGAGNAATGAYAQNFSNLMGGGGDGMSYNQFAQTSGGMPQNFGYGQNLYGGGQNPGFFTNFGTAAAGGDQTGIGGWLGSFFNRGGGG